MKFVPNGPIDNESTLVETVVWHHAGYMPLPKPMMTQFPDIYVWPNLNVLTH